MDKELLKEFILSAYEVSKAHKTILVDELLNDLNANEIEMINGFHPRKIHTINMDDEYFCSARANTFVVMFGVDEYSGYDKTILIQANHKGSMHFLMFPY